MISMSGMIGANTALLTHDFAGEFHLISFSLPPKDGSVQRRLAEREKAEMRGRNNPDTSLTLTLSSATRRRTDPSSGGRGERETPRTALTHKNK